MLSELLKYTQIADDCIIRIMQSGGASDKAIALFSHVLNAQHIWGRRINEQKPDFQVHQLHPVDAFAEMSSANMAALHDIVDRFRLNKRIVYKSTAGNMSEDAVFDIVFHVINHSTYHRAQIATEFRMAGIAPPVTDYIVLKGEALL